jgi:putative SOS response-associated peptidase YedK
MCGRFTLRTSANLVAETFGLFEGLGELPPRYNIAPTQTVLAIRRTDASPAFCRLRWGLVPFWADDLKIGNRLLNARADSVADKPAFRAAFVRRRCLIPADGFYEWTAVGKRKQPFHFQMRGGQPFAFAGLWERWGKDESAVESCTIITTDANGTVRPIHDRMPVILPARDHARWLDPAVADKSVLLEMLRPYPESEMTARAVSERVNSPKNEGPECLEPAGDAA